MGSTSIQWTDATWNPTRGCDKVSPGCKHCYAETFAERWRGVPGHAYELGFDPRTAPDKLDEPLHWKKPRRVFVNSMSDLFHEEFPDDYIDQVWNVMTLATQHTFQILTKRAERMQRYVAARVEKFRATFPNSAPGPIRPNVWLGVSVEDQERADERIPHLLRTPAAVRFLSCEPLLGPVELDATSAGDALSECDCRGNGCDACMGLGRIDWVIVGGESGSGARPMRLEWARSLVEQCKAAGVAAFCKQWGSAPVGVDGRLLKLRDRKGGDPTEWTGDWPREFPHAAGPQEFP